MKASDFIVEFLIRKGITDVFGYPGGMVTHLMDSFHKYKDSIRAHVTYHEQGAAFAACGYAQTSGRPGVAYATSGPGATNLITGICDAYFDSIPTIFITGQVNANEAKGEYGVRQRGFQETDIISIVKPITKYAVYVKCVEDLPKQLEYAYELSMEGRKGPVLLDIPMNVFREEVDENLELGSNFVENRILADTAEVIKVLKESLGDSKSPVVLVGAGVKSPDIIASIKRAVEIVDIPVVSSMIAFDVISTSENYFGFVGAYGNRSANFIVAKSDLIISIGSRMDIRQVGAKRENFAPGAQILRFDIDEGELEYFVHKDEIHCCADIKTVIEALENVETKDYSAWVNTCRSIKECLKNIDNTGINKLVKKISMGIPENVIITTDVGQNQVWVAQSFEVKTNQRVLFSGGHGAMGYSLPAAIGAYYGSGKQTVFCFTGDGGLQMNIQELQFVVRENIPIKIIVFNNNALGMIRHFQEMYFESRFFQTKPEGGYTSPSFTAIAKAYGIKSRCIDSGEFDGIEWFDGPELIEICIKEDTYVFPKLEFGKPNQDQEPLIDRELYEKIMEM